MAPVDTPGFVRPHPLPGDGGSALALLPVVYDELRALAAQRLRQAPPGSTLEPTELLHEAYLRLVKTDRVSYESRRHFVAAAAMAMRSVLVDRARARQAAKRGGGRRTALFDELSSIIASRPDDEVLALDAALTELEKSDERSARVVVLRYYLGLTEAQIADALGVTERTVRRDWTFARLWLQRALGAAAPIADGV